MTERTFTELELLPPIQHAIDELGFDTATGIQSEAIPLIRAGADVIGRSQTGTGKTIAFGIPALELLSRGGDRNGRHPASPRVLILCPTRELAQQACGEIQKLARYMHGVRCVEVYGGVPLERQVVRLKKADLVIGTPGRIMDHLRRGTLRLDGVQMVVLDEADEMLSMGFKEDMEAILADAPEERQTVLFSATMPPAILALTKEFQRDPQLVEIDRQHVTLDQIAQYYIDAPMGRKPDALNLLLRFHVPNRAMIFCNTKRMVDEVTEYLLKNDFAAAGLHGDMNQPQRTKTMDQFKAGHTAILVATDVAARGIDVNDIDYVINFDIPQSAEYYVHRIGRTGRAGKSGTAITICSGRRQVFTLREMARLTRSAISPLDIPTLAAIREKSMAGNMDLVEKAIGDGVNEAYVNMVNGLLAKGNSLPAIAAAALELAFGKAEREIVEIKPVRRAGSAEGGYRRISINIGRNARCAPNHIVGAIAERTGLSGSEIGKIDIYDDRTVVGIPADKLEEVLASMEGLKILGRPTVTTEYRESRPSRSAPRRNSRGKPGSGRRSKKGWE